MLKETKRSIRWVAKEKKKYAGIHLIAEFWGCDITEDPKEIEKILVTSAKKGGNTPLEVTVHKFSPQGMTGVVLLAESHIAIHSWPEYDYLAIDIFTSGEKSFPEKSMQYFKERFNPKRVQIERIKRGTFK